MLKSLTTIAIALSFLPCFALAKIATEPGVYQIDPMHSKVGFEATHLVISTVDGMFKKYEGQVEIDKEFSKSKVTAVVQIDSLDTGVEKRDGHLKSPDFFDAAKNPQMKFTSTAIKGSPQAFKMEGDLTIKGVTKKVTFDSKYLGAATDGFGNRKVAFVAKTTINRKDFGLNWNSMVEAGPVVGDDVVIELKIQAGHPVAKK